LLWTPELRAALFPELVKRFGRHSEWTYTGYCYPGRDLDKAYDCFTDSFAEVHGIESGKAVRMQVDNAARIKWDQTGDTESWGHQYGHTVRNIGAALAAGFLSGEEAKQRLADRLGD
jgi:hypothetical protein